MFEMLLPLRILSNVLWFLAPSASFVTSYWQWVLLAIVAVPALGYLAVVLRNWRIAVAVAALVIGGLGAQKLYSAGYNAHREEQHQVQLKVLRDRQKILETLNKEYARQKAQDDAAIADLEKKVNETPRNRAPSLPRASAGRVRTVR